MVVRPDWRAAVFRLLQHSKDAVATRPSVNRQRIRVQSPAVMFNRAPSQHPPPGRNRVMQQFYSRTPAPLGQQAMPLSTTSGNTSRSHQQSNAKIAGLKRNASGLTRALSSQGGFEEPLYPNLANSNPPPKQPPSQKDKIFFENEYFDENDFGSDIELELEDPKRKPTLTYPDISSQLPKTESPRGATSSDVPIPWSSSPVEHVTRTSSLSRFTFKRDSKNISTENDLNPRPKKRRAIPWLADEVKEEVAFSKPPSKSVGTPKSSYPWNTSASAMKQQRDHLRLGGKKLIKTNEATLESKTEAIVQIKKSKIHRVFLSDEQARILDLVVEHKKSIFFTGSAGTGKSVLLREIITHLRKNYAKEPDRVAITASTGLAACNIGGVTLHSFAGIGLGKGPVEDLVKKIRRNPKAKHRWMRTKVLIVDEVSMVDGDLYDKLEAVARRIRNNGRPFGGIQLVITGDFFQLPPVPEGGRQAQFAFNADSWNTTIEHTIALHKVFRQKDPEFAAMLNQMREGRLDSQSINKFRSLNRPLSFEDELEGTELYV
jgi:ATP-dependent DNA helicase PIF1